MTDLTNKWKKGKLPEGNDKQWCTYYIQHKDGTTNADSYWGGFWGVAEDNSIVEVLEKVPSYEEWQTKLEENTRLKELLKQARESVYVERASDNSLGDTVWNYTTKLINEINQVLGEDK